MTSAPVSPDPVLRQAARGYRATLLTQLVRMLCKVVSVVTLARLVSPQDHGRFAMAASLFGLLVLFRDAGLGTAVLQARVLDDVQRTALFWAQLLLGAGLAATALVLASPVAAFYGDPAVARLVAWMSGAFVLIGGGGLVRALLFRELRFERANAIETWSVVTGTATMIVVGALDGGAFAFVAFLLVSEAVATALAWRAHAWRPSGLPQWHSLHGLLRTGGAVTAYQALTFGLQQLDTITIGRCFGSNPLGLYNRAGQLLALPQLHVTAPLSQVLLASLARLRAGSPEFMRHAGETITVVAHLIFPLFAVCLVLPAETVRLVLGPQWPEAAPIIQVLAAGALAAAITSLACAVNVALNRPGRLVSSAALMLPLTALALWLGVRHGVLGVAAAVAAVNLLGAAPRVWWLLQDLPGGPAAFGRALLGPLGAMAVAAAGLWAGRSLAGPATSWVFRLSAGLCGGALALTLAGLLCPPLRHQWRAAREFLPARVAASSDATPPPPLP